MRTVDELAVRAQMCEMGRRLWQKGLVGASEGNLSVRLSPQRFLVTPSGVSKGHMRPADLLVVDQRGRVVGEGQPSSELGLHMTIYGARPDCQAVIHAHPSFATAFALAGCSLPDDVMPEAMMVLGSVALAPFGLTGTPALGESVRPFLADHKTILLANHGAVVLGRDLTDAYNRMETLERVAEVLFRAQSLGGAQPMPREVFEKLAPLYLHGRLT